MKRPIQLAREMASSSVSSLSRKSGQLRLANAGMPSSSICMSFFRVVSSWGAVMAAVSDGSVLGVVSLELGSLPPQATRPSTITSANTNATSFFMFFYLLMVFLCLQVKIIILQALGKSFHIYYIMSLHKSQFFL